MIGTSENGLWTAEMPAPTNEDAIDYWRYRVAMETLELAIANVQMAAPDTMSLEERDAKVGCLDDLRAQFRAVYKNNLPTVTFGEVVPG